MSNTTFPIYIVHVPYAEKPLSVFDDKAEAALFVYELREFYLGDRMLPEIFELKCNVPVMPKRQEPQE